MGVQAAVAALAVAGSAVGVTEQRQASKRAETRQSEANAVQKAQAGVEASQRRRRVIAQRRIAQAENVAQGVAQGIAPTSSPLAGAQASLSSSAGTNQANLNRSFASGQQTFDLRQESQRALQTGQQRANLAQIPGAALNTFAAAQNTFGGFNQKQTPIT